MEQDQTGTDREPAGAREAVARDEGPATGEAAAGDVDRDPDGRDRAADRVGDRTARAPEETPGRAGGRADEGADSAEQEDRKMPGMDGTGPMGNGPRGWGRGPCGRGQGRGPGQGAGNRFGQGGWFSRIWGRQYPGPAPTADKAALEEQVRMLESELQTVRQQLAAVGPTAKE